MFGLTYSREISDKVKLIAKYGLARVETVRVTETDDNTSLTFSFFSNDFFMEAGLLFGQRNRVSFELTANRTTSDLDRDVF